MVRTGRARIVTALVALTVAGVGFTVPTSASAAPPGLVRVGATSVLNSSDKTFTATCPSGTVVTGGGAYLTSPTAPHEGRVALDRLEPLNSGTGFTAAMREVTTDNENWRLSVDAMCATPPPGWDVVSSTGPLNTQIHSAGCGSKNVIGMGGRVNLGLGDVLLDTVLPTADLKTVYVRGTPIAGSGASGWSVTAFAVCADVDIDDLTLVTRNSAFTSDDRKTVTGSCPVGTGLYSLGADISPGAEKFLSNVHAISTTNMSWAADEDVSGYNLNWVLFGYGICGG
jgi:hypothetical protein